MKFSVIVPVYNVERYLEKCISSILNQNYDDFELVLIDDGSTDDSGIICDSFQQKNNKIKVIHKDNGGLSNARNVGIRKSDGDYLIFVDGDDWIEEDSLSAFAKAIVPQCPDLLETIIIEEYDKETIYTDCAFGEYLKGGFSRERALNWIINETESTWPAVKRICNRRFIIDNDLYFAESRLQEDLDWTTRVCLIAHSFKGCEKPWYHYRREREKSITNSISAKYIIDAIEMAAVNQQYNNDEKYSKMMFDKLICAVYSSINMYKYCNTTDKQIVCQYLKENKWIFNNTPVFKYKLFSLVVEMIGVKKSLQILSILG